MKKLNKILKFSAFTLLCTSSLLAAVGDNMSAGLGVNIGNDVQQQTYLDNYTADHGNGPLIGVDFQTQFKMMDTGSAVAMLDLRNVYYEKIKTDTLGVGFVYRLKNSSMFGQGFHIAYDYTWYDDLEFQQVAMGHEASYQGFDTTLNLYVPFGSNQHYTNNGVEYGGSNLTGLYGVDFTLAKKFQDVVLNAGVSYNFHDDITDNITAMNLGGEYQLNSMLLAGAKYQFRDGLLSGDYGYKVYAKVPLFAGAQDAGKGKGLSAPVKRQLGATIQYKEDSFCKNNGWITYAAYGTTWCSDQASAPWSDGANTESGATVDTSKAAQTLTIPVGKLVHFTKDTKIGKLVVNGTVSTQNATLLVGALDVIGTDSRPAMLLNASGAKALANSGLAWRKAFARNIPETDLSIDSVKEAIIVQSADSAISVLAAETALRTKSYDPSASATERADAYLGYLNTAASDVTTKVSIIAPSASSTNTLTKSMFTSGSATPAAKSASIGSRLSKAIIFNALHSWGNDINMSECIMFMSQASMVIGGDHTLNDNRFIVSSDMKTSYAFEIGAAASVAITGNTFDTRSAPEASGQQFTLMSEPNSTFFNRGITTTDDGFKASTRMLLAGNTFYHGDTEMAVLNGGHKLGANQGQNNIIFNNVFYVDSGHQPSKFNPNIGKFNIGGIGLNQLSAGGRGGVVTEANDLLMEGNEVIHNESSIVRNATSEGQRAAMTIGQGGAILGAIGQLQTFGTTDKIGIQYPTDASDGLDTVASSVQMSESTGRTPADTTGGIGVSRAGSATNQGLWDWEVHGLATAATPIITNSPFTAEGVSGMTNYTSAINDATKATAMTNLAENDAGAKPLTGALDTVLKVSNKGAVTNFTPAEISAHNIKDFFGSNVKARTGVTEGAVAALKYVSGVDSYDTASSPAATATTSTLPGGSMGGTYGSNTNHRITELQDVLDVLYEVETGISRGDSKNIRANKVRSLS